METQMDLDNDGSTQVQAIHIPVHHPNAILHFSLFNLHSLFILHCASVVHIHTFFHTFLQKNGELKIFTFSFSSSLLALSYGVNCHVCDLCIFVMFRMAVKVCEVNLSVFFKDLIFSNDHFFYLIKPDTGCININVATAIWKNSFFLIELP